MTLFIGDVHGKFDRYLKIIEKNVNTWQIGDLGIGFGDTIGEDKLKSAHRNSNLFIHGNHDSPDDCQDIPGYLGRYGVTSTLSYQDTWFCSGAKSIDKARRFENVDWWANEELGYHEMTRALATYKNQPIVISHDCPLSVYYKLGITRPDKSITNQGLDLILHNKPRIWLFGHHHKTYNFWHKGTLFVCLGELATATITHDYKVLLSQ